MISIEKLSITYIPEHSDYFGEISLGIFGHVFTVLTSVETVQEILQYVEGMSGMPVEVPEDALTESEDVEEYNEDHAEPSLSDVVGMVKELSNRIEAKRSAHHGVVVEEARDPDGNLLSDGYGIPPLG